MHENKNPMDNLWGAAIAIHVIFYAVIVAFIILLLMGDAALFVLGMEPWLRDTSQTLSAVAFTCIGGAYLYWLGWHIKDFKSLVTKSSTLVGRFEDFIFKLVYRMFDK